MSDFNISVEKLLKVEGGYQENKNDNGGATNGGISLRFLKSIQNNATALDVKNLTNEKIKKIYKIYFWDANKLTEINRQAIADRIFDMVVNMELNAAIRTIQKALNKLVNGIVTVDGIFGSKTMNAINLAHSECFIDKLKIECCLHYYNIALKNKSQRENLVSWIGRVVND